MTYISCFSDFAFYFYYYFMENCHTWIIISKWQNDLHTNTSRSVWPILYGLMIKMLQYKMYPAGELTVLRQLLFHFLWCKKSIYAMQKIWSYWLFVWRQGFVNISMTLMACIFAQSDWGFSWLLKYSEVSIILCGDWSDCLTVQATRFTPGVGRDRPKKTV